MQWLASKNRIRRVARRRVPSGTLTSERLRHWIEDHPQLLGEPLLLCGTSETLPPLIYPTVDILALDTSGNTVLISFAVERSYREILIDSILNIPAVAKLKQEILYRMSERYITRGRRSPTSLPFSTIFELFFASNPGFSSNDINQSQRLLIVGEHFTSQMDDFASWVKDRGVRIELFALQPYILDGDLYIDPCLVPLVSEQQKKGHEVPEMKKRQEMLFHQMETLSSGNMPEPDVKSPARSLKRVKVDHNGWVSHHYEDRCSPLTKSLLIRFSNWVQARFGASQPNYEHDEYVEFKLGSNSWCRVVTAKDHLTLDLALTTATFSRRSLAKFLGLPLHKNVSPDILRILDISVLPRNNGYHRQCVVSLWIPPAFDLENENFSRLFELTRHVY